MGRPRLLDLFCGAGGCAAGYVRAGFDVTGVDLRPQPRYLLSGASEFVQADALEYLAAHGREYDAIHASPPCQAYTSLRALWPGRDHPDLVAPTRDMLAGYAVPWVIENVVGSPLRSPVLLCGSMFGLKVRRHRLFECSDVLLAPQCRHREQGRPLGVYGNGGGGGRHNPARRHKGIGATLSEGRDAMGIDWMIQRELSQAIPPAYTEFLGRQLLRFLEG